VTVAYDETLADRVRDVLAGEPGLSERKMFGGLAFMLDGHMCCGVVGDRLMLRLGADAAAPRHKSSGCSQQSEALAALFAPLTMRLYRTKN
jgi:TfoX/Sxy family transcriptional regulator of competence genes